MHETESPVTGSSPSLTLGVSEQEFFSLLRRVDELERQVAEIPSAEQLESRVITRLSSHAPKPAPTPTTEELEQRILERVTAKLPKAAPREPDLETPQPSLQTVVDVAKSSWFLVEMFSDLKAVVWMLLDRRYHQAWWTRSLLIFFVCASLTSDFWFPLSLIRYVGWVFDKFFVLLLGLIAAWVLGREIERYREWRKSR